MRHRRAPHPSGPCGPCILLGLLLLAGPPAAAAPAGEGWPRWRGAGFDATAREEVALAEPLGLRVRWRRSLGTGYSGVVISDGRAVTMFSDGETDFLVALDAGSGSELWRLALGPTFPGREGAVDGPVSTPAIDAGQVFALGPRGDLVAARLQDGERLWEIDLLTERHAPPPHWGFGTSPLVVGDLLVVQTGGGAMVTAFDRHTGAVAWRGGADGVNYQSPILLEIDGKAQVVAAGDATIVGLDPVTGRRLWGADHGGSEFYRKILNPVVVGQRELLLTHRRSESKLIRLAGEPGDLRAEDAWTSPHLKLNYATPVHHRGFLYGYSGNFLTCVDAGSGALVWRSRPPGSGFPILVDGRLVILTKNGSLHVAEAGRRGYRELAAADVFHRLVWTPPSFAGGRVYARDSFSEVACVELVAASSAGGARTAERGMPPAGSAFARWIASLRRAPDKERRIREYLDRQESFPIVEGERWAHFVYRGEAEDLALRGGMLGAGEELPTRRVQGTDLHFASFELQPDARIVYQFRRDFEDPIPDPRNPRQAASLLYRGTVSLLLMPRSERAALEGAEERELRGRIDSFVFRTEKVQVGAKTWGGERAVHVYLPPGYDDGDRRYPAIYILHGVAMLEKARMDLLLEDLIGRDVAPVIAVFVESVSPYEYARSQRHVHRRAMVEELVPQVDGRYRTLAGAAHRAVLGADEAAYFALELGLSHAGLFGKIASQSVYPVGKGGDELLEAIAAAPGLPLQIHLDWGGYDMRDEARGVDVPGYGRRLREALERGGYRVTGREWSDGSDLALWAARSADALRALFPAAPAAPAGTAPPGARPAGGGP